MKNKLTCLILLGLILSLHTLGQISQDSIKISLQEGRNIAKSNERRIICEDKVLDLDSQILRLEIISENKDVKIADLYNVIDLNKDNFKQCNDAKAIIEADNRALKKTVRREKLKLILIVSSAVIVEVLTFKLLYK